MSVRGLFRLAVTAGLIGGIIWYLGGVRELADLTSGLDPLYVLAAFLVGTADRALMTYKWVKLLRARGLRLSLFRGLKIYCSSMIWGMFLPSTIGADAIRAFKAARTGLDGNEVLASIVVERIIGFLASLALGLLSLLVLSLLGVLDPRLRLVWWAGGALLFGSTLLFAASLSERLFALLHESLLHRFKETRVLRRLRQLHSTYQAYRAERRALLEFLVLTFTEQLGPILMAFLIARGLGIDVNLLLLVGAVPLSMLISRIPISISGLGVFDGVFVLLMSMAGVSAAAAVSIALVARVIEVGTWLPWFLLHALESGTLRPPRHAADRQSGVGHS